MKFRHFNSTTLLFVFVLFLLMGIGFAEVQAGRERMSNQTAPIIIAGKPATSGQANQPASLVSPNSTNNSFPAPNVPAGMDMDVQNNELLMASEQAGMLYVINPDNGATIRSLELPGIVNTDPGGYGIAVADTFWWHTDYQISKLYKLDPTNGAVLTELPMPHPYRYLGIEWDGTNLWGLRPMGAGVPGELLRIDPDTGDILEVITLLNIDGPIDLTWDKGNLWVSERDGYNYHQIDTEGNILQTKTAPYTWQAGIAVYQSDILIGLYYDEIIWWEELLYLPIITN